MLSSSLTEYFYVPSTIEKTNELISILENLKAHQFDENIFEVISLVLSCKDLNSELSKVVTDTVPEEKQELVASIIFKHVKQYLDAYIQNSYSNDENLLNEDNTVEEAFDLLVDYIDGTEFFVNKKSWKIETVVDALLNIPPFERSRHIASYLYNVSFDKLFDDAKEDCIHLAHLDKHMLEAHLRLHKQKRANNPNISKVSEDDQYTYSVVQAEVPDSVTILANDFCDKNIPEEVLHDDGIDTKGREIDSHITVLYGIEDETVDETEKALEEHLKPFKIKFGKIDKFDNDGFDVIYIDIESETLYKLNNVLRENLKFKNALDYNPHLTLAYVQSNSCDELLGNTFFTDIEVNITELTFSSKTGVQQSIDLTESKEKQDE